MPPQQLLEPRQFLTEPVGLAQRSFVVVGYGDEERGHFPPDRTRGRWCGTSAA
ncbi:MAG: hypothetical protein QM736_28935 [Vicinamibacterales bacterium]